MHKLALLSIALTSGCFWATTKGEGQALRKDVTALQERINTKERALDEQVAQLKTVLDDATRLLKRNSADLGADLEAVRADVRNAAGLTTAINDLKLAVDSYRKQNDARLDALEARLAQIESGKPSSSSSPEDLWKLGSTAFEASRYNDAIEIFRRLTQSFPTHDRADDALYFRGQSHTNLKEWDKAIGVYQMLVDKYPDGALADDGLYFAALAARQLKQCTEARTYLGIIKSKYAKSNVAKQATTLDAELKKDAKVKAKCAT